MILNDKQKGIIKAFYDYGIDVTEIGKSVTIISEVIFNDKQQIIDVNVKISGQKKPMEERSKDFYNLIAKTVKDTDYSKSPDQLRKFFEYWAEHGINDKKMRFEKETSFDVKRRLNTWFANSKRFNSEPTQSTSILNKRLSD